MEKGDLSLYLHMPFCNSKCNYCSFVSEVRKNDYKVAYIDALVEEIEYRAKEYRNFYNIKTIMFLKLWLRYGVEKILADIIFTEEMTSNEARLALFKAVEGKSKEEIEEIKTAYFEVLSKILERELKQAHEGWFID